jgi:hypothetical protein
MTLQRHNTEKLKKIFPEKELPGLSLNFCEQFIYSQDQSAYSAAEKYVDRSWEYINCSQPHMNMEVGTVTTQFLFWKYINGIFVAVHIDCIPGKCLFQKRQHRSFLLRSKK